MQFLARVGDLQPDLGRVDGLGVQVRIGGQGQRIFLFIAEHALVAEGGVGREPLGHLHGAGGVGLGAVEPPP